MTYHVFGGTLNLAQSQSMDRHVVVIGTESYVMFSDPRNMASFGVVTDVRLANVLGLNSSVAALMLRPSNMSVVHASTVDCCYCSYY